jgi:hypothetical protein
MNKKIVISVSAILLVMVGVLAVNKTMKTDGVLGASPAATNVLSSITQGTTSTYAALPVPVLSRDAYRRYATICNDHASTKVYLVLKNFDSNTAASTTFGTAAPNGVLVAGNSCYEINPDNLFIGDVWASSTVSGIKIHFNYE